MAFFSIELMPYDLEKNRIFKVSEVKPQKKGHVIHTTHSLIWIGIPISKAYKYDKLK